jgi:hypothetical protein
MTRKMLNSCESLFLCFFLLLSAKVGYAQTPDMEEWSLLASINNYRAQHGTAPLQVSVTLERAARWMSDNLAKKNYIRNIDSLGRDVGPRLLDFGYPYYHAENIAAGNANAEATLSQWIAACAPDSSGNCTYTNRRNILNPDFRAIGVGRAFSPSSAYRWYWTADFGGVLEGLNAVSVTPNGGRGLEQTFTALYIDPDGASDLQVVYLDIGTAISAPNSCIVVYVPASNTLNLFNDAGTGLVTGSIKAGGSGVLSNGQCTLSGSGGMATQSSDHYTVPFAMKFEGQFTGLKNIYGMAQSYRGVQSEWQMLGTWTP